MKIKIYYQNEIQNSWKGFDINPNGSITIENIDDIALSENAIMHNNDTPWGIVEIKGVLKKGIWFPIEHHNGDACNLASSTYVLWE